MESVAGPSNAPQIEMVFEDSTDASDTTAYSDTLYDPTIEMLIDERDDEDTLDEEEALAAAEHENPSEELTSLQRESDMPLSELLALYGYRVLTGSESPVEENYAPSDAMDDVEREIGPVNRRSKLRNLYRKFGSDSSRLLRSGSKVDDDDEDDEFIYTQEEWRKINKVCTVDGKYLYGSKYINTIMIGVDHQAVIPEGICHYDDALPYENEDKLLWDPNQLRMPVTHDFLKRATDVIIPPGKSVLNIRDNEQALYLLVQCGYNIEEALRRIRINVVPTAKMRNLWSEDECRNFESGIRSFGKNFYLIQKNKVRTRSIGELVQFYYLWKKCERHEFYGSKTKHEKRKYIMHADVADFMDRFLEEYEHTEHGATPSVARSTAEVNKRLALNRQKLKRKKIT